MENTEKKIRDSYIAYTGTHRREPASIELFMQDIDLQEADFYRSFHSFEHLNTCIWQHICETTIDRMKAQEVYEGYVVRQKMLSFAYTLLEELQPHRDYMAFCLANYTNFFRVPTFLDRFKESFLRLAKELVAEGMDSDEVAPRPFISDQYENLLWLNITFIMHYWSKDDSREFERTDAAVEKSVNFVFDLLTRGVFDSAFDFGKFLLQIK